MIKPTKPVKASDVKVNYDNIKVLQAYGHHDRFKLPKRIQAEIARMEADQDKKFYPRFIDDRKLDFNLDLEWQIVNDPDRGQPFKRDNTTLMIFPEDLRKRIQDARRETYEDRVQTAADAIVSDGGGRERIRVTFPKEKD